MIISKNIKAKIELPVTNEKIHRIFENSGIKPVRWAIVGVQNENFTISVSYEVQ